MNLPLSSAKIPNPTHPTGMLAERRRWTSTILSLTAVVALVGCASSTPSKRSTPLPSSTTPSSGAKPTSAPRSTGAYSARGQATYYGGKYQGRKTASGEPFDKNALTAAHENITFGTRVKVTNLENGKSVIVVVNDRFKPFKGRIIDLSEAAFLKLAPLARGVIPVLIEVVSAPSSLR